MKKLKYAFLLIVMAVLFVQCEKDDEFKEPDPEPTGNFTTTDVKVSLPEGVNLDLSKTKIVSYGEEFNVSADGTAKPFVFQNERNMVYLADENENIVLVAFISKTENDISVKSSAKASLFFSLGTVFQFPEVKELYFKEYDNLPEMDKFYEELNVLFKTNRNFLETSDFQTLLKSKTEELIGEKQIVDISTKSIDISDYDYKSGVKIIEEKINKISFENDFRRRTHAFIYRVASKKLNDKDFKVEVSDVTTQNVSAFLDQKLNTPIALTNILGGGVTLLTGEGAKVDVATTGPIELKLENDDDEVKYLVRVIGPTCPTLGGISRLTKIEQEVLKKLQIEAMAIDLFLPILSSALGSTGFSIDGIDEKTLEGYVAIVSTIIETIPSAKKALYEDNNPLKALLDVSKDVLLSGTNASRDILIDKFIELKQIKNSKFEPEGLKRSGKLLKYTDLLLQAQDLISVVYRNCSSNELEEWEVIVKKANVNLTPEESGVSIREQLLLEAKVDEGEAGDYNFGWKTTGKYGVLTNDRGVDLQVYPVSAQNKVAYKPTVSADDLPDNATDLVIVEVYDGINLVGSDTSIVHIYNNKYRIIPNGVTISGNTRLTLQLVDNESKPVSTDKLGSSFKIVWNSPEEYGYLDKLLGGSTRNKNTIQYVCLDTEVNQAIENFSAKLYRFSKAENKYVHIGGDAEAAINIKNEPNVKRYIVPLKYRHFTVWNTSVATVVAVAYFEITAEPDAISYEVVVKDYSINNNTIGRRYSWEPGANLPKGDNVGSGASGLTQYSDKVYHANTNVSTSGSAYADPMLAYYAALTGYADVTIQLKPK